MSEADRTFWVDTPRPHRCDIIVTTRAIYAACSRHGGLEMAELHVSDIEPFVRFMGQHESCAPRESIVTLLRLRAVVLDFESRVGEVVAAMTLAEAKAEHEREEDWWRRLRERQRMRLRAAACGLPA